jgi:3-isopropylmalate/(R)-2-methylmalate dehydratase small subunit
MNVTGSVWKFALDDIDTDQIRRAVYSHLPKEEQGRHCLESLDPTFASRAQPGDIVVAGKNFGCGSSRPAHVALLAVGIGAVLAESFGRLFFRNSISGGLLVVPCPGIVDLASAGDRIEVDTVQGRVRNVTSGRTLSFPPMPAFLREMVELGGEKPYLRKWLERQRAELQG